MVNAMIHGGVDDCGTTIRKAEGSSPDEVTVFFFSMHLIFPTHYGPGVYSASNRN
jgi:hypothetical protein